MDVEKQKRNRVIRLVITEVIMVAMIVGLVVTLMLIVSGYRVNDDLSLEQSGLVQIFSRPTGSEVIIDGEKLSSKTNTSKLLSGGEHTVQVSKKGYSTWEKQVKVTPGLLLRLKYVRLFKTERTPETVLNFDQLKFLSASPLGTTLLYAVDDTLQWRQLTIKGDVVSEAMVDLAGVFEGESFAGTVERFAWSKSGERVLIKVRLGEQVQWGLLDLRNASSSVNLTREFGLEFSDVQLASDAGDRLLVLEHQNLREISLGSKEVSRVLLSNVAEFWANGTELGYVTVADEAGARVVGLYKNGEQGGVVAHQVKDPAVSVHVAVTEYFNEKYLVYTINGKLYVYKGDSFPAYGGNLKGMELVIDGKKVVDGALTVSANGEFVMARADGQMMVLDAETDYVALYQWQGETRPRFIDNYLLADVREGKLTVWDFDGTNQRVLSEAAAGFDAVISANNKYLYYVAPAENGYALLREKL